MKRRIPKVFPKVLAGWGESTVGGPGWSNALVWYIVRDPLTGEITRGALQPEEQTENLRLLFKISESCNKSFVEEITKILEKRNNEQSQG